MIFLSPKRPKPRDWREKKQKITRREKKVKENEFKQLKLNCPNCYKAKIVLIPSRSLEKMIIYCLECFCGDLVDFKENGEERYYYNKFKDRFRISWKTARINTREAKNHYFNQEIHSGSLKDFKKYIMEKLGDILKKELGMPFFFTSYAIKTGNPYDILQTIDNPKKVHSYLEKSREKARIESLSKEEREREFVRKTIELGKQLNARMRRAREREEKRLKK